MTTYILIAALIFAVSFSLMIFFSKSILLKLSTVAVLFVISNQIYFGFESMKGWPTEEKPDSKGQLLWAIVNEPSSDDPGAIYMWVYLPDTDLSWYKKFITYQPTDPAPRAIKIPYNEKTAEQLNKAKQAMEEGYAVEVDFNSGNEVKEGPNGEQQDGTAEQSPDASSGDINSTAKIDENLPRFRLIDPRDIVRKGQQ